MVHRVITLRVVSDGCSADCNSVASAFQVRILGHARFALSSNRQDG